MGCVRLDILDEQYYRTELWDGYISKGSAPVQMRSEAIKNYEEQRDEYLAAEKVGAVAEIIFSAKTFFCFVFFSHKKNEEYFGYDAWGRRYLHENDEKHYFDQKIVNCQLSIVNFFQRGYTGHEHLDLFGLINMNGRMYDPMLGRFLSPDPYVQSPTFSQSFNRYSYVWNNPLRFVDPSGYWVESNWGHGVDYSQWVGGKGFDWTGQFKASVTQSAIAPCWFGGGGWSPSSAGSLYGQGWNTINAVWGQRNFERQRNQISNILSGFGLMFGRDAGTVGLSGFEMTFNIRTGASYTNKISFERMLRERDFYMHLMAQLNGLYMRNWFDNVANSWNDNRNSIGAMFEGAGVFGKLADVPKIARIGHAGTIMSAPQAIRDIGPLFRGELQGMERKDAVNNMVSMMGWQGATISLGYLGVKEFAKGIQQLERELEQKLRLHLTRRFP